ncbi:hypothetical protein TNCT_93001 [Trichonephila clavata]|uniref:Uncharacterized protein n=1 Tax=Trichonephila clavata TaxID=2740835 RepID=A0A8X6HQH3_TRICU|nr:hypothetical protein TNCT_93001 [Trichonephila clavata]
MEDFMPVNVPGFDLIYFNTAKRRQIATTSSVAVSSASSRKAGAVAIYHINSFTDYKRVNSDISEINLGMKDAKAGDLCLLVVVRVNAILACCIASIFTRIKGSQHSTFEFVTSSPSSQCKAVWIQDLRTVKNFKTDGIAPFDKCAKF